MISPAYLTETADEGERDSVIARGKSADEIQTDNIGAYHFSVLKHIENAVLPTEGRTFTHTYKVHCNARSFHNNAILFEVGVVPLFPVREELDDVLDNVHKQYIDITAWNVSDVKKLGIFIPDPEFPVSEDVEMQVNAVLHNNGPFGPVTVVDTFTNPQIPPDCTSTPVDMNGAPPPAAGTQNVSLPVSLDVVVEQDYTVHCTQPSNHTFSWCDSIAIDNNPAGPFWHVRDSNPNNNSACTQQTFPFVAEADVADGGAFTVVCPPTVAAGVNFVCAVNVDVYNYGPYGPVNVIGSANLTVPPDCTRVPNGPQPFGPVVAPVGVHVPVVKNWTVNCANQSNHQINASDIIRLVPTVHVCDPLPAGPPTPCNNDNTNSNYDIVAITKTADIKLTNFGVTDDLPGLAGNQILVTAGEDFPAAVGAPELPPVCGNDVDDDGDTTPDDGCPDLPPVQRPFTTSETLHNNGPFGPITVNVSHTSTDGAQCNIGPAALGPDAILLPVSVPVNNSENWTVDWTSLSKPPFSCNGSIGKTVDFSVEHVSDPSPIGTPSLAITFVRDTDGDTVPDNYNGVIDNCEGVPNPGQQDTDNDTIGDACDDTPRHDPGVKNCSKFGPSPINLSDTVGAYMWVICEIGNFSGHDDIVTLNFTIGGNLPGAPGCVVTKVLVIPGQLTFTLLKDEQKFVLHRVKFECHGVTPSDTSLEGLYQINVCLSISHNPHPVDPNPLHNDHEGGDHNPGNNQVCIPQNVIVSSVEP